MQSQTPSDRGTESHGSFIAHSCELSANQDSRVALKRGNPAFLFISTTCICLIAIGEVFIKNSVKTPVFINRLQILTGIIALLFGVLVYLVDRPPDQAYFVYKTGVDISLHNTLPNLFGIIGQSLPSFAHVFSFILITAGLIASKKKEFIFICLFWFLIDSVFELGQKFSAMFIKFIPDWFASVPFLENTGDYFVRGTFSFGDMAAITIGTITAYFLLIMTSERGKLHHEKRE